MLHFPGGAVAIMTLFDDADRPAKKVFYDENDRVVRRVVLRYDNSGNLVEEGEMEPGGAIREDFRNVYRYDAPGRQIEAGKYFDYYGGQTLKRSYNEFGDITEESRQPAQANRSQRHTSRRPFYRVRGRPSGSELLLTERRPLPLRDRLFRFVRHRRRVGRQFRILILRLADVARDLVLLNLVDH